MVHDLSRTLLGTAILVRILIEIPSTLSERSQHSDLLTVSFRIMQDFLASFSKRVEPRVDMSMVFITELKVVNQTAISEDLDLEQLRI